MDSLDSLATLDEARLERLARVARRLLAGRPLHHSGRLPHPRSTPAGLEFLEHRPLTPGDDPRHVDWRASARSRSPLVRRYRDERAGEWLILLDHSASMGAAPGVWPLARQLAEALAYLLVGLEHRVGLALFSESLDQTQPSGRGRMAYLALRRTLAAARPQKTGGGSRLESCLSLLGRGRQAAVISDFLAPNSMAPALAQIRGRSDAVHAFQVIGADGHDVRPHPSTSSPRPFRLVDSESGATIDALVSPDLVARVAERRQALASGLEEHCRRQRILYSACPVGTAWDRVLLAHLVGPEARLA